MSKQNQLPRRELAKAAKRLWVAPALTVLLSASQLPARMSNWPSGGIPALGKPVATNCKAAGLTAGVDCYEPR